MTQPIVSFYLPPEDFTKLRERANGVSPHLLVKALVQNYLEGRPTPILTPHSALQDWLDMVHKAAWKVHQMARSRDFLEATTHLLNVLGKRPSNHVSKETAAVISAHQRPETPEEAKASWDAVDASIEGCEEMNEVAQRDFEHQLYKQTGDCDQ